MTKMFSTLFTYQAWANAAFFDKLEIMDAARQPTQFHQAMRLMNHAYIVTEIFAAHLTGRVHGYTADNPIETPSLADLRHLVSASDAWYLDYVHDVMPAKLTEQIAFTFTDGDRGHMSREEMLTHVVLHGGYHRGEVGRILTQQAVETPWDTFAVFLHRTGPERRQQGKLELAAS